MRTTNRFVKMVLRVATAFAAGSLLSVPALAAEVPDALPTVANSRVKEVIAAQEAVTDELMEKEDGILGTAVGQDDQGNLALVVYVNSEHKRMREIVAEMPHTMRGERVKLEVIDPIRPLLKFKPMASLTSGHTSNQTRPIQLGTSGGWRYDLANGYCCGGTLGSLVKIGTRQYILGNYHVFRSDIVNGGNGRVALPGDPIIQPGLIDTACNAGSGNARDVAMLAGSASLPDSNVDAAIAEVISGQVRTDGSILGIGTISASTFAASLNQKVKKSGRTTGLTRSTVIGLNATVSVTYDNECAGGTAFTKTFMGQILVANNRSRFIAGGDSGSLMVQDVTTKPKAVGLLFAGSSSIAVANPIGQVLSFFGASMVGQ